MARIGTGNIRVGSATAHGTGKKYEIYNTSPRPEGSIPPVKIPSDTTQTPVQTPVPTPEVPPRPEIETASTLSAPSFMDSPIMQERNKFEQFLIQRHDVPINIGRKEINQETIKRAAESERELFEGTFGGQFRYEDRNQMPLQFKAAWNQAKLTARKQIQDQLIAGVQQQIDAHKERMKLFDKHFSKPKLVEVINEVGQRVLVPEQEGLVMPAKDIYEEYAKDPEGTLLKIADIESAKKLGAKAGEGDLGEPAGVDKKTGQVIYKSRTGQGLVTKDGKAYETVDMRKLTPEEATIANKETIKENIIDRFGTPTDKWGGYQVLEDKGKRDRMFGWLRYREIQKKSGVLNEDELNKVELALLTDLRFPAELIDTIAIMRMGGMSDEQLRIAISDYANVPYEPDKSKIKPNPNMPPKPNMP